MHSDEQELRKALQQTVRALVATVALLLLLMVFMIFYLLVDWQQLPLFSSFSNSKAGAVAAPRTTSDSWRAPLMDGTVSEEIRYGRELIVHTAEYLGPRGKVAVLTNGMSCQNCHLEAGTKYYGNNYSAVAATYPKFRARSGTSETIIRRITDCFERSLNGQAPDSNSREMRAMVAYIRWLGKDVTAGKVPKGAGLPELSYLDRPADPVKGANLFVVKCVSCHGKDGQGQFNAEQTAYTYPPLWGEHSYNTGAGLLRLSRFAGYIKANMPLGATADNPQLTDEEAWDLAAYVNTQPRPRKVFIGDWPDVSKKPVDHPYGPFTDGFSEQQHTFGPFGPIKKAAEERKKKQEKKS